MFEDRTHRFVGFGLPADDVARVRAATTDFWKNEPGGWVYEWSGAGRRVRGPEPAAPRRARLRLRQVPVPWGRRPKDSLSKQIDAYLAAAPGFVVGFERRVLNLPTRSGSVDLPVHIFTAAEIFGAAVLMISAGVAPQ